jgi:Iron-containing redox enzyme
MSLCGLHRRLRGALVDQLVAAELTCSPSSDRLVQAMRRLGCGPAAIKSFAEHMESDAVHEHTCCCADGPRIDPHCVPPPGRPTAVLIPVTGMLVHVPATRRGCDRGAMVTELIATGM